MKKLTPLTISASEEYPSIIVLHFPHGKDAKMYHPSLYSMLQGMEMAHCVHDDAQAQKSLLREYFKSCVYDDYVRKGSMLGESDPEFLEE